MSKYILKEGKMVKINEAMDLRRNRPAKIDNYERLIHLLQYVPQANELQFNLPDFFSHSALKSKVITNPEEQKKYEKEVDAVSEEIKKFSLTLKRKY